MRVSMSNRMKRCRLKKDLVNSQTPASLLWPLGRTKGTIDSERSPIVAKNGSPLSMSVVKVVDNCNPTVVSYLIRPTFPNIWTITH